MALRLVAVWQFGLRRTSLRGAAWSCIALGVLSCSLGLSGKSACDTDADCNEGFSCITRICSSNASKASGGTPGDHADATNGGAAGTAPGGAPNGGWAGTNRAGDGGAAGDAELSTGLDSLVPTAGVLAPRFSKAVSEYGLTLPLLVSELGFTVTSGTAADLALNGQPLISGMPSALAPLTLVDSFRFDWAAVDEPARSYTVRTQRGGLGPAAFLRSTQAGPLIFASALAVDGDTLAVGASDHVDVFELQNGSWVLDTHLQPKVTHADDHFGQSVALYGDTLVVGAAMEDSGSSGVNGVQGDQSAVDSGAAYVFVREQGAWVEQAYLKASNTGAADGFGWSVAISADTIAVAAPEESSAARGVDGDQSDNSAGAAGAVYVFTRSGASWLQSAYLKASNTNTLGNLSHVFFGSALALQGNDLAVGAPYEPSAATGVNGAQDDVSAIGAGAVYAFERANDKWRQTAYIKASNTDAGDAFGTSLSYDHGLLAVGAPREDSSARGVDMQQSNNNAPDSGAAYLFGKGSSWMQIAYLKAADARSGDLFGDSLTLRGQTLAIGADSESRHDGSAYVFVPDSGVWAQRAYFTASIARGVSTEDLLSDGFGLNVALSAQTLIVAAPYERESTSDPLTGAAYFFR
jgi:hypothetical protein